MFYWFKDMANKLHTQKSRKSRLGMILIGILILLSLLFYILLRSHFSLFGTDPKELLNYTQGEFILTSYNPITFQDYYSQVLPTEEKMITSDYDELPVIYYTVTTPRLDIGYTPSVEPEYYAHCGGKKVEINFTKPKYSKFKFNYAFTTFSYNINLYYDLYSFSNHLKGQDCYFETDKYIEGFLEDPYNNNFIKSISEDFLSLREKGYSNNEIVEIATLFVQSIPYGTDDSELNKYPYETIYEMEGNCLDKSLILTGILDNLGYTSYIILGHFEEESHAIVGIVCDNGNLNYQEKEICFIETTVFSPIGYKEEMNIEEYMQVSNGSLIYSEVRYGFNLSNYLSDLLVEVTSIKGQLDIMESQLADLSYKMCQTDCTFCNPAIPDPRFCYDANKYNNYIRQYNKIVENYNSLLEEWYRIYYLLERTMFENVEYLQRNSESAV